MAEMWMGLRRCSCDGGETRCDCCGSELYCGAACDHGDLERKRAARRETDADLGGFIALEKLVALDRARTAVVSPSSLLSAMGAASLAMDDVAKRDIAGAFGTAAANAGAARAAAAAAGSCNSIWFADSATGRMPGAIAFAKSAAEAYGATVAFGATARRINAWVKEKTRGAIEKIVADGDVSGSRMIVANALAFKCKWERPFDARRSVDDSPFNGGKTRCRMMRRPSESVYGVFSAEGFGCVLDLAQEPSAAPAGAGDYRLRVVLAMRRDAAMPGECFVRGVASAAKTLPDVAVSVPATSASLEPRDVKALLGLREALEPGHIAFDRTLSVTRIVHCARLEFDELGAEGAAATAVVFRCTAVLRAHPETHEMTFDRPFFAGVAVYGRESREPITFAFASFVVDPSKG